MAPNHYASAFWLIVVLSYVPVSFSHITPNSGNEPLYLTPFIESGRIQEAQKLSKVAPMLEGVESFSGYLTVNKTYNSNMFFWFVKSQHRQWDERPLLVWLEGGLGPTSIYGMFEEVGPFHVRKRKKQKRDLQRPRAPWRGAKRKEPKGNANSGTDEAYMKPETSSKETRKRPTTASKETSLKPDTGLQEASITPETGSQEKLTETPAQDITFSGTHYNSWRTDFKLVRRKYAWTRKYNVVFIDSPIGTGFSFTDSDSGYAKDADDGARDLLETLDQFYRLFPALQKNNLYIVGQCYGGKFALLAALKIYRLNRKTDTGNRFSIPIPAGFISWGAAALAVDFSSMTRYGTFLNNLGLLDHQQLQEIDSIEDEITAHIRAGNYTQSVKVFIKERAKIRELTGFKHLQDWIRDNVGSGPNTSTFQFLNQTDVKQAIHVGNKDINSGTKAVLHMLANIQQPIKQEFEELLMAEAFPFICFSGNLDIDGGYNMQLDFYRSLEWPYAMDYHNAKRCQFKVGNRVAAYYKTAGTFTEVLVRNTGHWIASTQPRWAYELMDAFIENKTRLRCP